MTNRPFVLLVSALVAACTGEPSEADELLLSDAGRSPRSNGGGGERAGAGSESSTRDGGGTAGAARDGGAHATDGGAAGPSTSKPSTPPIATCKLDTRAVYVAGGRKIESITAYGMYWSREITADGSAVEAVGFPHAVASDPKFAAGPCGGVSSCKLDTRAIFFDGATKTEWTTAYGHAWQWTFDIDGSPVNPGGPGTPIASVAAWASGPCSYAGNGTCTFGTRTFEIEGASRVETITAYGRWFEYALAGGTRTPQGSFGAPIESIARFAAGACATQPAGACVLDTRTIYVDLDGSRTEEVTARNRLWVYTLSASGAVTAEKIDGAPIASIPRLAQPCTNGPLT